MRNKSSYPIIPFGHSGTEYYYYIITIEHKSLKFRKYIYDSYSNNITHATTFTHNTGKDNLYGAVGCQLMNYINQQVVSCMYGKDKKVYWKVFNTSLNF